jgi:AcrR family transcriptional regulator
VSTSPRQPRQDRSQKTADRVVEATLELIQLEGLGAVTIAAVAKKAESTNGSIYHLFGDKQTLVDQAQTVFLERLEKDLYSGISESAMLPTLDEVVFRICETFVAAFSQHAGLLRAFLVEGRNVASLRNRGTETALRTERLAVSVLKSRSDCDEASAVWAVYLMISAQINHLIFGEPMFMNSPPTTPGIFTEKLSESILRIIAPR